MLEKYDWRKNYLRIFGIKRSKEGKTYALAEFKGDRSVLSDLGGSWNAQGNVYVGYFPFEDHLADVLAKHHLTSAYPTPSEFVASIYITRKSELKEVLKELYDRGINVKVNKVIRLKPNAGLTQKQFEAIRVAYSLGYFDYPKRASIRDVAQKLGVSVSTATELLRRAERRLVEAYLRGIS
ncbi:MAG: helix-turn-helix domain-containing protein [Thermoprotei archaeon]